MTTTELSTTVEPETSTRSRVRLIAIGLAVTAIAAVPGGLLWPEPAGGGETYTYADIAGTRDLWWGLLVSLAILGVVGVPMQALASMVLVRRRGAGWVTAGGAVMWLGIAMQAVGVGGWATAYFFPTDPAVPTAAGTAVIDQLNQDTAHLFGVMIPGALLVIVGTVLQAVGLFRSRAVPKWVPVLCLTAVLTFVVPGNGIAGLLTALPMTAGALALAYYAWKRTA